jgi:UDP-N-acetylmuramyl pentapeptide phosphotransferase/UDP-N-acetylglucosamine-1-phosphate transferase
VKGILAAGTISLIISLFGTPFAISLFRGRGYGQLIRGARRRWAAR